MLDAVNFISHVKNTTAGAKDSKVLVTGGSYGGFLTTVLKMNHPDVFYGALPFAAPLRSIGANYQNPQRYNWFKWVRSSDTVKTYQRDADEVPAESSILGLVRQRGWQDEACV
jgi:dipeptidyl aminopeptidase/acylaminoacyl peptidase